MRAKRVKILRKMAKELAEGLPIVSYQEINKQTKMYQNPMMNEPIEYATSTIVLADSRRSIYRKLKSNAKIKQ